MLVKLFLLVVNCGRSSIAVLNTIKRWLAKEASPAEQPSATRVQRIEAKNDAAGEAPRAPAAQTLRAPANGGQFVRVLMSGDMYRPATDKAPMQAWLEALPSTVRPIALAGIYPRIVKKIMRLWSDDAALKAYLDELAIDRRGGRIGFPPKVATEILRLQVFIHQRVVTPDATRDADLSLPSVPLHGRYRP